MAFPTNVPGSKFVVEIGDGATPTEAFDAPCSLSTKGINFTGTPTESEVRDCDNKDLAGWVVRRMNLLSAEITGGGTLALADFDIWQEWFQSGATKNVRVTQNLAAPDGGHYLGPFILTGFEWTGNDGEMQQIAVTMQSAGPVLWTDAP